ncbi:Arginyl-tRNA--protein transferase 1 [Steccherinum ochraceum]|uniref:Arginyl-tRNA--protein transferase 1 n=1 Tax=Steccherinum ochraceum TaxID=92696 RepID=A0A4R0RL49_9APHY|nr:Arginyl-tRNA--protein transferase 1 [Steccherinum ochraceum]
MDLESQQKGFSSKRSKGGKASQNIPAFELDTALHASEARYLKGESAAHVFEVTLEPSSFTEEKFALYKSYQQEIHNETEKKPESFKRFLVETPLQLEDIPYPGYPPPHLPRKYGSYHQLYRLDGKLIAMGVIDVLPACVSSVYFMYEKTWDRLSLGKMSALREITLSNEMRAAGVPGMDFLYMGFYIYTCAKMRYKGEYSPSYLADPEDYTWHPLEKCIPLLAKNRYATFSHPEHSIAESFKGPPHDPQVPMSDLAEIPVYLGTTNFASLKSYVESEDEEQDPVALKRATTMTRFRPFSLLRQTWGRAKDYHPVARWTLSTLVWLPIGIVFTETFYTVKTVSGRSMQPTLNPDSSLARDVVVFDRWSIVLGNWKRGDVVALLSPSDQKLIVKRLVALPGDTVKTLPPYPDQEVVIPEGHAWVEGDEPFRSEDSNYFGPVPLGLFDSKLSFIVYPFQRFGPLPEPAPPDQKAPRGLEWRNKAADYERQQKRIARVTTASQQRVAGAGSLTSQ